MRLNIILTRTIPEAEAAQRLARAFDVILSANDETETAGADTVGSQDQRRTLQAAVHMADGAGPAGT